MPEQTAVPNPLSAAPTRTRPGRHPPGPAGAARWCPRGFLLQSEQLITSPETRLQYRIERLLGEGGFGQVYLAQAARPLDARARGRLHQGQRAHRRLAARGVLRPAARRASPGDPRLRHVPADPQPDGRVLYCLALEYARHGDLSAFLHRTGKGWPEASARREIAGILEVLGKLHRGQLLHRDLTPLNVFVCDGPRLKLGDFGIVRQQSDRRGVTRRHAEPADRAQRHPRRRRPEVAGARRRLPGGAAAGHAGEGRRARADPHRARSAACPAATT